MVAIAGVTTKKNLKGQLTHVTIDVRKHKQVIPIFNEMGLVPKTAFQKECEGAISLEEFRTEMHKKIETLWKPKK
jgi:hypothetical protein